MNWKLVGEVYGVFSKFSFMVDSERFNVSDELINAYEEASRDLENGIINQDKIQMILDFITDNTNSNYWVDFDEPLFYDDEEDIEVLDLDDENDCDCCSKCSCCDDEPEIDIEEVKHWAKMIGNALDEAAKENGKPVRIKITVSEEK